MNSLHKIRGGYYLTDSIPLSVSLIGTEGSELMPV